MLAATRMMEVSLTMRAEIWISWSLRGELREILHPQLRVQDDVRTAFARSVQ